MRFAAHLASLAAFTIFALPALAQQVFTEPELAAIVDDSQLIEDFEGVSLHGGGTFPAPNPLNADAVPLWWGLHPGITYTSAGSLSLYAGSLHGDDSIILRSDNGLTIDFEVLQAAVGFDVVNPSTASTWLYTLTMYRDAEVIATADVDLTGRYFTYFGWDARGVGINRIEISSTSPFGGTSVIIDNVQWGLEVSRCPPDLNDDGFLDAGDIAVFVDLFLGSDIQVDLNNDGFLDSGDISTFVTMFIAGC